MGWSVTLCSSKIIAEDEIQDIVDCLPENLSSPIGNGKQRWGWHTGVDISLPKGKTIRISGSYGISGKIAVEFENYLRHKLVENNHVIRLEENW